MVAPIVTGILRESIKRSTPAPVPGLPNRQFVSHYSKVIGSKQAKPYNTPLPYSRTTVTASWTGNYSAANDYSADLAYPKIFTFTQSTRDLARNKSYERLKDKLLNDAQGLATALAEYNQASLMIAQRAKQLRTFLVQLKRGNLKLASRALSVSAHRNERNRSFSQNLADLWLEYHFGWEPMLKDMHDSLVVLANPVKESWGRASCTEGFTLNNSGSLNGSENFRLTCNGTVTSVMSATVQVTNPNMFLANQLGFLNPALVAWELVPFSFVVDWFVNVGAVISSMTDFMGCTLKDPYHTDCHKVGYTYSVFTKVGGGYASVNGLCSYVDRNSGLIQPVLVAKPVKVQSLSRAATEVSLLLQFMTDRSRRLL